MELVKTLKGNFVKVRTAAGLKMEEKLTLIFLIFSATLCWHFRVPFIAGIGEYAFFIFAILLPAFLLYCFVGTLLVKYFGGVDVKNEILTKRNLLSLTRAILVLVAGFYAYSHLKILIPLVNSANFDQLFFDLDRMLFLGISPTLALLKIKSPLFMQLMYISYASFYAVFPIAVTFAFVTNNRILMRRTILGMLLIYMVGIALYYLLPAWGPLFFTPDYFVEIPNKWQAILWSGRNAVIAGDPNFIPHQFFGVAAMPSLHAAHFLFLYLVLYKFYRWVSWFFIPWMILMYTATIYMGWHYVIDLIVGALMAIGIVAICNRVIKE